MEYRERYFTVDSESDAELDNNYYLLESPLSEALHTENASDIDDDKQLLEIIDFIHTDNLDISNMGRLLSLLNSIHSNVTLSKSGHKLWKCIEIKFTFKTNIYCSICNRQLSKFADKCSCFNGDQNMNTELLLFSILREIRRVVKINFNLMEFFNNYHHEFMYDIINSILYLSY
ncbi:unnamed protein product [Adineta steineri]|uniref:Uncharacterized protein n=2 Tax=Adineta steineri TaxID=433720 RepID=A0A814J6C4_9BILA|nr:unnamed protein product [Adineta steineri]CAF1033788.1 unnamed protein product [Adineta steineri]